jgi:hypothetical protein
MATNKINVVEKTPGKHIEYALSGGKKITFGDDELTINLASRERDFEVSLDICIDEEDGVVIGTGGRAQKYAAQIVIPARRYDIIEDGEDENGEPKEVPMPIPFDMSLCTLILWELEV